MAYARFPTNGWNGMVNVDVLRIYGICDAVNTIEFLINLRPNRIPID